MKIIIFFFILVTFVGCVNSELIRPEYLTSDTTKDILVITNLGKSIRMYAGNYQVVQTDTIKYLNGKGTIIKENNHVPSTPFEGTMSFAEIVQIETREKTALYYSGYYIFAGAAAFIIFVILIYNGRGAGG